MDDPPPPYPGDSLSPPADGSHENTAMEMEEQKKKENNAITAQPLGNAGSFPTPTPPVHVPQAHPVTTTNDSCLWCWWCNGGSCNCGDGDHHHNSGCNCCSDEDCNDCCDCGDCCGDCDCGDCGDCDCGDCACGDCGDCGGCNC